MRVSRLRLAQTHGIFNVVGGLWPLLHIRSFEFVFGPKYDRWLVYTVAGLLVANGGTQLRAAGTHDGQRIAGWLGAGTAATLLAIDVTYAPRGRISKMYLVDAAMEAGWIVAWAAWSQRNSSATALRSRSPNAAAIASPTNLRFASA